ncbi:hypothetical protein PG997_000914 [Apiospora hydei]|uniref:Uncharacterized protein n=1 Tax=Apiospora hydei TaxID=1337664 RepID=A0ABR1XC80_9PEZI
MRVSSSGLVMLGLLSGQSLAGLYFSIPLGGFNTKPLPLHSGPFNTIPLNFGGGGGGGGGGSGSGSGTGTVAQCPAALAPPPCAAAQPPPPCGTAQPPPPCPTPGCPKHPTYDQRVKDDLYCSASGEEPLYDLNGNFVMCN